MSNKVTCSITGQSLLFGKDYWEKKITEYGSEENLRNFYCTKKAKTLLQRGYSVGEIRKILNIDNNVLPENDNSVKNTVNFHTNTNNVKNKRIESALNFSMQISDEDVTVFINNIKKQSL